MKRINPKFWVSPRPFGIGLHKPFHHLDMVKIAWANRRNGRYAWKVLTQGVCDGCALGVAGLHDWTMDDVHLCLTRLRLLEINCADPIDDSAFRDVASLRLKSGKQLRDLGRLAHPMRRRRGERGFTQISWDEALDVVTDRLRATDPDRVGMFITSRGITNETYYAAGKAARAMGIANVDSAARICHAPSTTALKATVGIAATTCSLSDLFTTDLVVIWGANPANNQPVFMKYLYKARMTGTRVVVINPFLEPGLENYWVPSTTESALFGTKMCDLHIPVRPGGDVAFADAALKRLLERNEVDHAFINDHTENWNEVVAHLAGLTYEELLAEAGLIMSQLDSFVDEYANASAAILLWSMGITQHKHAGEGVRGIVNLALARGNVGRNGAGLMPLRGHSGVQGGAEMGAYATALPGGLEPNQANAAALSQQWGFEVPARAGMTAAEMPEAALAGDLDVLWMSGGNFLEALPDPRSVERSLEHVPLRVHQDIVLSSQMLIPGDDVIVLPVSTRYEQEGGGTETTTERRIVFSPEIPREVGEARSEWRLFSEIAARVRPETSEAFSWRDNQQLREEIASVVPAYAGIESLAKTGDEVQWGGPHLCEGGVFPTPNGRGQFSVLTRPSLDLPEGMFTVATRRGKQFNTMVQGELDPFTGAGRDAIFIDAVDATALGFANGDLATLRSETGEYTGRLLVTSLAQRSLQVFWPEGNVLIPSGPEHRESASRVPDYNAIVSISPAEVL
ncbi:MAG: FdhF/YdeP family oxidoreductase [Acidimicrobiales bacterium]